MYVALAGAEALDCESLPLRSHIVAINLTSPCSKVAKLQNAAEELQGMLKERPVRLMVINAKMEWHFSAGIYEELVLL